MTIFMESIKDMRNIGCLDDLPLDAHFFTKDEYDYYMKIVILF